LFIPFFQYPYQNKKGADDDLLLLLFKIFPLNYDKIFSKR
jgi:hypothetical protein